MAARAHSGQLRKASDLPYFQHLAAVTLILARLGFSERVLIAAALHDVVEDTSVTLEQIEAQFGPEVRELVDACSESKRLPDGRPRPWDVRKREHLAKLEQASAEARSIVLADKLQNLMSIAADLEAREDVWSRFNAPREAWLNHYQQAIDRLARDRDTNASIERLAEQCLRVLTQVRDADSAAADAHAASP